MLLLFVSFCSDKPRKISQTKAFLSIHFVLAPKHPILESCLDPRLIVQVLILEFKISNIFNCFIALPICILLQSTFVGKNLMFFIEFTSIFEFHCLPCPLPLFTFPVSLHKLQKCKLSFCFLNSLIYVKDKTDENELDKAYDNIIENKF